MAQIIRDPKFDSEQDELSRTLYRRTYRAGPGVSLADLSLEAGDMVPVDDHVAAATAEIIQSWLDTMGARRVARVVAVVFKFE